MSNRKSSAEVYTTGSVGLGSFISAPEQMRLDASTSRLPSQSSSNGSLPRFQTMSNPSGKRNSAEADLGGEEDDEEEEEEGGGGDAGQGGGGERKYSKKRNATSTGRRKIEIQYIDDKSKRHVSFTKRKAGLMKKAYELSTLTGTEALILVVSDTGLVYTYATPRLRPVIDGEKGRAFITASLKGELEDTIPGTTMPTQLELEEDIGMGERIVVDPSLENPNLEYPTSSSFIGGLFASHTTIADSTYHLPPLPAPPNGSINIYSLPDYPAAQRLSTSSSSTSPLPPPLPLPLHSHLSGSPPRFQPPSLHHGTDHVQTPYERAAAEHARAFANYRAQISSSAPGSGETYSTPLPVTLPLPSSGDGKASSIFSNAVPASSASRPPVFGSHSFSDEARHWKVPVDHMGNGRSFRGERERSGSAGTGTGEDIGNGADGKVEMEERKRNLRAEKERLLGVAKEDPTIPNFLSAYFAHVRSKQMCPPALISIVGSPLTGKESTLDAFEKVAIVYGFEEVEKLEDTAWAYLGVYLPSQSSTPSQSNLAKSHLVEFFDFLESNALITPNHHTVLTGFAKEPASGFHLLRVEEGQEEGEGLHLLGDAGVRELEFASRQAIGEGVEG